MKLSAYKAAGHKQLRRRFIKQLSTEPRKLSTYRMFRSREFQELCEFYLEGIGIRRFEQFCQYAMELEQSFDQQRSPAQ